MKRLLAVLLILATPAFAAELLNGSGSLETTDADNTTRFAEGQAASSVNNGTRALEGMLARYFKDADGRTAITGAADNYTFAMNADNGAALYDGMVIVGDVTNTNTGATAFLNLTPDGGAALGAITIKKASDKPIEFGDMQAGGKYTLIYDGTNFQLMNPSALDEHLDVGTAGEVTNDLQPSFLAYNSSTDANVTGNGAVATVDFDTEVFDQGGDFTGDTFTAPVTGKYYLQAAVVVQNIDSAADLIQIVIVTSNRSYEAIIDVTDGLAANSRTYMVSVVADMDSGDTATVTAEVSGMAGDTVDILGAGTLTQTRFSGFLAN